MNKYRVRVVKKVEEEIIVEAGNKMEAIRRAEGMAKLVEKGRVLENEICVSNIILLPS
jgi:hypothetical protein